MGQRPITIKQMKSNNWNTAANALFFPSQVCSHWHCRHHDVVASSRLADLISPLLHNITTMHVVMLPRFFYSSYRNNIMLRLLLHKKQQSCRGSKEFHRLFFVMIESHAWRHYRAAQEQKTDDSEMPSRFGGHEQPAPMMMIMIIAAIIELGANYKWNREWVEWSSMYIECVIQTEL